MGWSSYPNPVSDVLILKAEAEQNFSGMIYRLYNSSGQLLNTAQIQEVSTTISTRGIADGLYTLRLMRGYGMLAWQPTGFCGSERTGDRAKHPITRALTPCGMRMIFFNIVCRTASSPSCCMQAVFSERTNIVRWRFNVVNKMMVGPSLAL